MTLKTVYVSIGFLSGLFLSFYASDLMLWAVAFVLLTCLVSFLLSSTARKIILLAAASFFAALLVFTGYTHTHLTPLEQLSGEMVQFEGRVESIRLKDRSQIIVSGEVNGIKCKAAVYLTNFSGDLCDNVSFAATAESFTSQGLFDERSYYLPDGIFLRLVPEGEITVTTPHSYTVGDRLKLYSRHCSERIREYVSGDESAFLTAMATGDTDYLSDNFRRILNRVGIGHVTSVSGLHVTVAAALILYIFRKLNLAHSVCSLLAYIPVIAYVIFAGGEISAIRSAGMFLIYILSTLFLRRPHSCNTLALCAMIVTLFDPYSAADTSFILSLSGVFGVGVLAPEICKRLNIRSKLLEGLIVSLAACLVVSPALMLYFDEISILSPLMNFALPLCSVALVLTLAFVLLGALPVFSFLPKLAAIALKPVIFLSEKLSSCEFAAIPVLDDKLAIAAVLLTLICLLFLLLMKSPKLKGIFAMTVLAVFLFIYSVGYTSHFGKLKIDVIYSGKEAVCLLHKADECIIIDINNGADLAYYADRVMTRSGVDRLLLAAANKNGESAYSVYSQMFISPDEIYLPENSYIYGGEIPVYSLGEQNTIRFADCTVSLTDGGLHISHKSESISIAYGLSQTGNMTLSLFDGAAIVNGEPVAGEGILTFVLD